MFEVLHKDLLGRIGRLHTPHGVVETPTIMPVINPNLILVKPCDMAEYGAEIIITNAYVIYRNQSLREEALRRGVHALIGWEKPLMTDSGSYQLYEYGDLGVRNREIVEFQVRIGSDIVVPLDIPTPPFVSRRKALKDVEETLRRAEEAKTLVNLRDEERPLIAGVVQGSTYTDLRESCAERLSGFDIYPIGGIVPLLEIYDFKRIVDIVMAVKRKLPPNAPVHLFGAGHPMFFALAVAMGCDIFDSAAYALYARDGRYLTNEGTYHVKNLNYLPCSCPICTSHSVRELMESVEILASHNLYATFEEMRTVKQSIVEGSLWELCERRCRAHPALLDGLKRFAKYADFIEKYDSATKHPFFYLSEISAKRPEVRRFAKKISRLNLRGNVLITTSMLSEHEAEKRRYDHILIMKPPFGAFPEELSETYPVGQSEIPEDIEDSALEIALENVMKLINANKNAKFTVECEERWMKLKKMEDLREMENVVIVHR